jgi:hypothetical protein
MTGASRRKPNAVLALIDAAIVRIQLKKMGAHNPGPANMRRPDKGGTRSDQRRETR